MNIPIINTSKNELPSYATLGSAGMDIRADLENKISILPMERILIPTGLSLQLPKGYEAQIRPRSGLAYKNGITVLNSPGTIDSDYILPIQVLLINLSQEPFVINPGDRIAQMVISSHETVEWTVVDVLTKTERNGGFGSTGVK